MTQKRLIYRSDGTDCQMIVCNTIEEAINCFRADCEAVMNGPPIEIDLHSREMTDADVSAASEL